MEKGENESLRALANDIGFANLDIERPLRNGLQEVIYGEGKTYEQVKGIVEALLARGQNIFATRIEKEMGERLSKEFARLTYDCVSRTFSIIQKDVMPVNGSVAILAAGTSDIPVAEEACTTVAFFGAKPVRYYDVGVAGLHRLINRVPEIKRSDILIVIAGMEGALPSVVGGIFSQPVIAVPTSIGYGVCENGRTALMAMLTSCAEGIVVTNIDNGFGAACAAIRILNRYANMNLK